MRANWGFQQSWQSWQWKGVKLNLSGEVIKGEKIWEINVPGRSDKLKWTQELLCVWRAAQEKKF